jgi:hypothetical protein
VSRLDLRVLRCHCQCCNWCVLSLSNNFRFLSMRREIQSLRRMTVGGFGVPRLPTCLAVRAANYKSLSCSSIASFFPLYFSSSCLFLPFHSVNNVVTRWQRLVGAPYLLGCSPPPVLILNASPPLLSPHALIVNCIALSPLLRPFTLLCSDR